MAALQVLRERRGDRRLEVELQLALPDRPEVVRLDEPVLPRLVLEAALPLLPRVARLLPEDLLKLGLGRLRAGERRVLELPAVLPDAAPVGEQDPDVLVLLLPYLSHVS